MHASGRYFRNLPIVLAIALAGGCTTLRAPETQLSPVGGRAAKYDSAAIRYRLSPASVAPDPGDVQRVSYSQPAAAPGPTQFLSIEYPHPAGRKGFALAEVIVARDPSITSKRSNDWLAGFRRVTRDRMPGLTFGEGIESAWTLDVPIAEVDALVHRLDEQHYFADSIRPAAGAELSARINGLDFSKPWPAVPELNALVGRVRREGNLVSHREPLEALTPRSNGAPVATVPMSPVPSTSAPAASPPVTAAQITPAVYTTPAQEPVAGPCERLPPVE